MDTKGLQDGVNKAGTSIKNIVAGLGIDRIISAGWSMISQNLDSAISRLDTLNNFPRVMSNLGIDAESSQKAIDDLAKRLEGIPTTLDDAAMAVERFTSKNGDVEESVEIFDAVNNAILAGGAGADIQKSALEQLSQAYSKGKPDMMEWRTMQMAMPAQLKQVAQAMNMTADELGEGLREGRISMDDFIDTMIKLNKEGVDGFQSFEQQAKNSTGGIKTSITNAKTAIARGIANIVDNIDKGLKEAGLGGIAGVVSNVGKIIEKALKSIGSLFSKILPPIINFLKKAFELLQKYAPVVKAVLTAILAYKSIITIVSVVNSVKSAFSSLFATMAANPFALIIAGLAAVAVAAKSYADKALKPVQEAEEKMKSHITAMGQAFNDYSNKIQNATSMMSAYGRQLFITAEEDQRIQDQMTSIQDSITAITSQAHAERRALSQEEIDKVDEYLRKLQELSGQYIEVSQRGGQAMVQQAETELGNFEGTYEEFADAAAKHLKTVQDYEEQTTQSIEQNVTQQIAILNQEYEGIAHDDAYEQRYNEIVKWGEKEKATIKENVQTVRQITQEGLDDRLGMLQTDLDNVNNLINRRNQLHQEAIQASEDRSLIGMKNFKDHYEEYAKNVQDTDNKITEYLDDGAAERLGIWINNIAEFKEAGGELTDEQQRMAESILDIFEKTNAGNTESTKEMYKQLKQIVKTDGNELVDSAKDTTGQIEDSFEGMGESGYKGGTNLMDGAGNGIDDKLAETKAKAMIAAQAIVASFQSGLKENSPSKATYQMAEYFLKGFENGLRDNQADTFKQVDNLGQDIIDKMNNAVVVETGKINAKASISNNINRMFTINASFDGNVELDNRKVGRIVAPEVSRAIKVGGL